MICKWCGNKIISGQTVCSCGIKVPAVIECNEIWGGTLNNTLPSGAAAWSRPLNDPERNAIGIQKEDRTPEKPLSQNVAAAAAPDSGTVADRPNVDVPKTKKAPLPGTMRKRNTLGKVFIAAVLFCVVLAVANVVLITQVLRLNRENEDLVSCVEDLQDQLDGEGYVKQEDLDAAEAMIDDLQEQLEALQSEKETEYPVEQQDGGATVELPFFSAPDETAASAAEETVIPDPDEQFDEEQSSDSALVEASDAENPVLFDADKASMEGDPTDSWHGTPVQESNTMTLQRSEESSGRSYVCSEQEGIVEYHWQISYNGELWMDVETGDIPFSYTVSDETALCRCVVVADNVYAVYPDQSEE